MHLLLQHQASEGLHRPLKATRSHFHEPGSKQEVTLWLLLVACGGCLSLRRLKGGSNCIWKVLQLGQVERPNAGLTRHWVASHSLRNPGLTTYSELVTTFFVFKASVSV